MPFPGKADVGKADLGKLLSRAVPSFRAVGEQVENASIFCDVRTGNI